MSFYFPHAHAPNSPQYHKIFVLNFLTFQLCSGLFRLHMMKFRSLVRKYFTTTSGIENESESENVESFCDDILLEIFSFLEARELKNVAFVCRNWNEVIGSTGEVMRNFKLKISGPTIGENFYSTRRHQNFEFHQLRLQDVERVLERFEIAQTRGFWYVDSLATVPCIEMIRLLSKMQLLETLVLTDLQIDFTNFDGLQPLTLPKLKRLTVASNDWQLLNFITARELKEFSDSTRCKTTDQALIPYLADFLEKSEKLEKLRLRASVFKSLSEAISRFKFSLKCFELHGRYKDLVSDEFNDSVCEFLIAQAHSLTSLYFNTSGIHFDDDVHQTIFEHLKNLSSLSLDVYGLSPTETEFYTNQILSLHDIKITGNIEDSETLEKTLQNSPNLKSLTLDFEIKSHVFNYLNEFNPILEHLFVGAFNCTVTEQLFFEDLKSLSVLRVDNLPQFLQFVSKCCSIEEVVVRNVDNGKINRNAVLDLLKRGSLRHLKFGGEIKKLRPIYDMLKMNFGSLQSLEMETTGARKIGLEFPDHKLTWRLRTLDDLFDKAGTA